jgi:transcriptional regulator with XRE-family HTH domain
MYLAEIGHQIRLARKKMGLSQRDLAEAVGLSRSTVNQFERGRFGELGAERLSQLLSAVGLELAIAPVTKATSGRDFVKLACISSNVSYRDRLTPDELTVSLLTGRVPSSRRPHMRVVFDEIPDSVFTGMLDQVEKWSDPGTISRNARLIAESIHSPRALSL